MNEQQADKIIELLQNLFIIEAKKNGLSSENVRKILGINNNTISNTWKLLSKTEKNEKDK